LNQITIYSSYKSNRLSYITKLIFDQLLGVQSSITNNIDDFNSRTGAKINYSKEESVGGFHIKPQSLLFENDIRDIKTSLGKSWLDLPGLILGESQHFDILAASFFLVSRYEEYLPFEKDAHQRFTAERSCLTRLGLLNRPIVNEWALALLDQLTKANPDLVSNPRSFEYLSTIDIDQAWKYKHKGFLRTVGGICRDLIKRDWAELKERIAVLRGRKSDPFYNFDWQDEIHQQKGNNTQYFVQIGKRGKFDKNTSISKTPFQNLIKRLDSAYSVGIHPSYRSNTEHALLKSEHHIFENIVAHNVHVSRQHFLMHEMPDTYLRLLDIDITEDHTMGYSTHMGFRAGIAAPFMFFDLTNNEETKLQLIPFCCMDITPLHYLSLTSDQAVLKVKSQMDAVKAVGGLFVSLWHNESLSESGRWRNWRSVYSSMISHAKVLTNS
jgi:hypothetical protein